MAIGDAIPATGPHATRHAELDTAVLGLQSAVTNLGDAAATDAQARVDLEHTRAVAAEAGLQTQVTANTTGLGTLNTKVDALPDLVNIPAIIASPTPPPVGPLALGSLWFKTAS